MPSVRVPSAEVMEFVSEDEAVQGVESGRYYAAYVIPADFSADFASVLTGKPEHPTITYYANEKHSAVATKVTDSGATALERKVNEQFASAASEAASSAARDAAKSQDSTEEASGTFDMHNYAKTKLRHGRFYAVSTTIPKISPNPMKSVTLKEVPRTITVVIVAITGSMVPRSTARMEPAS